jgi:argininosuccinate lyase
MGKLWGSRFEGGTDELVKRLGESVSFDARLARHDVRGSMAHARMLGDCGIISKEDAVAILQGLEEIHAEIAGGRFALDPMLEDVHTNIEAALVERIGEAGKRLHTGRSRNDQIALDVRLWLRDQVDAVLHLLLELEKALLDLAEAHEDVILPGFTHLQHAQPVLLAHHLLAYLEMFDRDRARFAEMRPRINIMPLGSAALAGTPHPVDRGQVARELGFNAMTRNSMDAVSDRDHLIEFCADAAIAMMHLSRLSEELIVWSTLEFGFIEIGDGFTTGSSIMPQKKNPDAAELVRGKTGRVYGDLVALLTVMKALPLTYNRDMQEDKEPLFDASDTLQLSLAVIARMLPSISVRKDRMAQAVREGYMEATDLADYLAAKGVPFRRAHEIAGRIVRQCEQEGRKLTDLSTREYQVYSPAFEDDVHNALKPERMLARRASAGATAPERVHEAILEARERLASPI